MKQFIFWTGIYNISIGSAFLFPPIVAMFRISLPDSAVWLQLPASLVIYLGVMLILCTRDLRHRATLVYYEGLLRIFVSVLLLGYGLFSDVGLIMAVLGVVDLVIGVVYLAGLPRHLQISPLQLLLE